MRKYHATTSLKPKLDYCDAQHAFFIHAGAVYPVATAPSPIFKAAVLSRQPHWKHCAEYSKVLKTEMDIMARWWLLNCLEDAHRGITLYRSRVEAERECRQVG